MDSLTDKLNSFYKLGLTGDLRSSFKSNLEKTIASTFQLTCPTMSLSGTGFFIGDQGQFITNAHVLDVGQYSSCMIKTNSIEANRVKQSEWQDVILKIDTGFLSRYRFDTSFGQVLLPAAKIASFFNDVEETKTKNMASTNYLTVSNQDPQSDLLLFAIGYPMETSRDGKMPIEKRKEWDQKYKDNCKKELGAPLLPEKYEEILATSATTIGEKRRIENDLYKTYNKILCDVGQKARTGSLQVNVFQDYDKVPSGDKALVISAGRVQWQDRYLIITDGELLPGMSGSPLVDLSTAKVYGTNFATLGFLDKETKKYSMQFSWGGSQAAKKISEQIKTEIISEISTYDSSLKSAIKETGGIDFRPCKSKGLFLFGLQCGELNVNPKIKADNITAACLPKGVLYGSREVGFKKTNDWDSIWLDKALNFSGLSIQTIPCEDRYTQNSAGCCVADDGSCLWDVEVARLCTPENINKVCISEKRIATVFLKEKSCLSRF